MKPIPIEEKIKRYLYGKVASEIAYAKINLGLKLLGKREDGYHELDMVNTLISCHDTLNFYESAIDRIEIMTSCNICPLEENIVYKTIMLIKEKYNIKKGLRVDLEKGIPMGAGLGGGSADAAATIRALNKLWELKMTREEMLSIAEKIGSDVPYLIDGGFARVTGRGEKIEKIDNEVPFYIVVVYPDYALSTKQVFSNCETQSSKGNVDNIIYSINKKSYSLLSVHLFNDLEDSANKIANQLGKTSPQEIKKLLKDMGCDAVSMSGSGSAVYGIVDGVLKMKRISNSLERNYPEYKIIFAKSVTKEFLKQEDERRKGPDIKVETNDVIEVTKKIKKKVKKIYKKKIKNLEKEDDLLGI